MMELYLHSWWRGASLIKHREKFTLYFYIFRRKRQNKKLFFCMKETKEVKNIAVVAETFHFGDNATLKKWNGTLIVDDSSVQLKIHNRKADRERERDTAALAKLHPERNRFQFSEGIVFGRYVSIDEQHSRKKHLKDKYRKLLSITVVAIKQKKEIQDYENWAF
jgi:hypothetical protein